MLANVVFLVLFFLILFIACAVVWQSYVGRNILAQNSEFSDANVDDRGYVAVEWWIMSKTQAENPAMKEGTTRTSTSTKEHVWCTVKRLSTVF